MGVSMIDLKSWCESRHWEELLGCYMEADNPLPPECIGFSSGKLVEWKCRVCGQKWYATPNKMNRKRQDRTVCPFCSHERPSAFYNAAVLYPELIHYWDVEKNQGRLEDYLPKSGYNAHWRCKQGHTWTRPIDEQVKATERYRRNPSPPSGGLCPYCSHRRTSTFYNLAAIHPEIADQWDYSKNGALTPRMVSPSSQKKVFWRCAFNPAHTWADRISNRTQLLRGCPICSRHFHISYTARAIYYYLYRNQVLCACEVQAGRYIIDIEIQSPPLSSRPIALEIDGYHHHKTAEAAAREARKDEYLRKQGYRVIRVKERPEQDEGIQTDGDTITYPFSEQNRHLDRVIQYLLVFIAGVHIEPNHIKDHWKIEAFYNHTRKERSLAVQYPELAKEWSEKNEEGPDVVSPGLGKKRWWKCPKCQREYQATVHNRTYHHSSCPYCAHIRATPENCLAAVYPEVAAEWDEAKNAPLKPTDVLPGTDKSVWWKCKKGHSWRALIYTRTGPKPTKCPYCQGHAVEPKTSLAGKTPALAQYWHPSKNAVSPEQVAPNSNQVFWWQCPEGHEWQEAPNQLQKHVPDRICPYCNRRRLSKEYCLAASNPPLARLWHPLKNSCTAEQIAPYSNKKVWWKCEKGHEWEASPGQMQGRGAEKACPYCNNRKVWAGNSLAYLAPELAADWHPDRNAPLTPEQVFPWSSKRVWWKCKKGHEWQTTPAKRHLRGDGCPYCSGHRASAENCLAAIHPEIAKEWDGEKNAPLTPQDVTPGSGKRVWWKCKQGHTWQSTVDGRIHSKGCPVCHHEQIRHQSFAKEHPELLAEWDAGKNDRPPEQYAARSNAKVWWKCKQGHRWQATLDSRSQGSGCPVCAREQRKRNLN